MLKIRGGGEKEHPSFPFMFQILPEKWEKKAKTAMAEQIRKTMFSQIYILIPKKSLIFFFR